MLVDKDVVFTNTRLYFGGGFQQVDLLVESNHNYYHLCPNKMNCSGGERKL